MRRPVDLPPPTPNPHDNPRSDRDRYPSTVRVNLTPAEYATIKAAAGKRHPAMWAAEVLLGAASTNRSESGRSLCPRCGGVVRVGEDHERCA